METNHAGVSEQPLPPFLALNVHLFVNWASPLGADGRSHQQGVRSFALLLPVRPRFLLEWKGNNAGMDWWERALDSVRGDRARRTPLREEWAREASPSALGEIPVFAIAGNCVGKGGRSFLSADAAREHNQSTERWLRGEFLARLKRENIAFPWSQWTLTPPRRPGELWPNGESIGALCRAFEREALLSGMAGASIVGAPEQEPGREPRRL